MLLWLEELVELLELLLLDELLHSLSEDELLDDELLLDELLCWVSLAIWSKQIVNL